jgi:hypothetical protein
MSQLLSLCWVGHSILSSFLYNIFFSHSISKSRSRSVPNVVASRRWFMTLVERPSSILFSYCSQLTTSHYIKIHSTFVFGMWMLCVQFGSRETLKIRSNYDWFSSYNFLRVTCKIGASMNRWTWQIFAWNKQFIEDRK